MHLSVSVSFFPLIIRFSCISLPLHSSSLCPISLQKTRLPVCLAPCHSVSVTRSFFQRRIEIASTTSYILPHSGLFMTTLIHLQVAAFVYKICSATIWAVLDYPSPWKAFFFLSFHSHNIVLFNATCLGRWLKWWHRTSVFYAGAEDDNSLKGWWESSRLLSIQL